MSISGPTKYVQAFLSDIAKAAPHGSVADFTRDYRDSVVLRQMIELLYPQIQIRVK